MPSDLVFHAYGRTKVYETGAGKVHALRGVDLDIARGEIVVLLGPSGSGKSTLLNILGGLDRPSAGQVLFQDWDVAQASDRELTEYRRRSVGSSLVVTLNALRVRGGGGRWTSS